MLDKRKHNQQGDDEPAVVKTDWNSGNSAELDLCLHGREASETRRDTPAFWTRPRIWNGCTLIQYSTPQAVR
jgi:hypothetical protein